MKPKTVEKLRTTSTTILRVTLGVIFLMHGLDKASNGLEGVAGFLGSLNVPLPALFAPLLIGLEVIGGILLIIGLATRIIALLLFVNILVALFSVHLSAGFMAADGGFEFVLLLAVALLGFVLTGPGSLSVDRFFVREKRAYRY